MTPSIGISATEKPAPRSGYPLAGLTHRTGTDAPSVLDDDVRLAAAAAHPREAEGDDGFDFHLGVYAAF